MSQETVRKPSANDGKSGRAPQTFRVLDLFAGCGGLSLGFQRAGFNIAAAVEFDELAAKSHAANFYRDADETVRESHSHAVDITEADPADLFDRLGIPESQRRADVIIGGPPCQTFARVGRAKLREVLDHPEAFKLDPRKDLYLRFIDYVLAVKPSVVLMENVPDVMNSGGHNVPEETCEILDKNGYDSGYTLLNAALYGVPQMRERMFLLAWSKRFNTPVTFPSPSHWIELPIGYDGSRSVALKNLRRKNRQHSCGFADHFYIEPPPANASLPAAVTAEEALRDLPPITVHLTEEGLRRGPRRFDTLARYRDDVEPTEYGKLMRTWPGYGSSEGVYDHVIRSLPRDYATFRRMQPGDQYPEAFRVAEAMLEEEIARLTAEGRSLDKTEISRLRKSIVPPYDPTKFPNKWRKMEADRPTRTLMAHIGKDSYSHIHYDSDQARTISVREAARLQSFPDGFLFRGTMNPAFRQIGNAVPPLLSYVLARHVMEILKRGQSCEDSSQ